MTPQDKMKTKLEQIGIPYKEIKCYGSQIMITAWSEDAARRWASVLKKFSTVRTPIASVDHAKVNQNTMLKPSLIHVWRIWATIK